MDWGIQADNIDRVQASYLHIYPTAYKTSSLGSISQVISAFITPKTKLFIHPTQNLLPL